MRKLLLAAVAVMGLSELKITIPSAPRAPYRYLAAMVVTSLAKTCPGAQHAPIRFYWP